MTKKSKSFKTLEENSNQLYGQGSISGPVAYENVCFEKSNDLSCIENVSFVAVSKASDTK
jgi:hypothetical protein